MPEVLNNLKGEIARRGKKLKDLAEALPMSYNRLSLVINGFMRAPEGFHFECRRVLEKWDSERVNYEINH